MAPKKKKQPAKAASAKSAQKKQPAKAASGKSAPAKSALAIAQDVIKNPGNYDQGYTKEAYAANPDSVIGRGLYGGGLPSQDGNNYGLQGYYVPTATNGIGPDSNVLFAAGGRSDAEMQAFLDSNWGPGGRYYGGTASAAAAPAATAQAAAARVRGFGGSGAVMSLSEAKRIAEQRGITVAQVMSKGLAKGGALGAGLVNQFNAGKLGINTSNPYAPGANKGTAQALQNLQALQGLQMNKGQAYAGYTTNTSTGSNVYSPIVLPRSVVTGVQRVQTGGKPAAAAAPAAGGEVANWENSVNNSNQALIDSINGQIEANATQSQLYMGQIDSLMQAMQQQAMNPNGGLQSFTPYAVTTNVAPATGAQTTQAITARKKPAVTDLTLNPLVMADAGTGLNIGI